MKARTIDSYLLQDTLKSASALARTRSGWRLLNEANTVWFAKYLKGTPIYAIKCFESSRPLKHCKGFGRRRDNAKSGLRRGRGCEGGTLTVAEKVTLSEHGPNFFRVYGTEKEVMSMITITSDVDLTSVGRNRILGVPAPVPEPSALLALGIGVALLAVRKRR